ncbi:MAG TPA: hypothetical protein VNA30_00765 [Mycobacteriales bacterium]|nr:hypothetical protein [Mycobacteriales bacterium]
MSPEDKSADHQHVVNNGKRDLTLDELARQSPGMDRLMAEVGPRVHRMYYAARAGNWPLAAYFSKSVIKQLRLCAESRPAYEPEMSDYLERDFAPVAAAIKARDAKAFEASYGVMVDRANALHVAFAKPYLVWVTPSEPPADLDLSAGMS